MAKTKCYLCNINYCDQNSHIIPKFAFKWLKETSATNYIRMGKNVNIRVQDGLKIRLLCNKCEKLFNKWETKFANEIFYPVHNSEKIKVNYKEWLFKFSVSVSWRVLIHHKLNSGIPSQLSTSSLNLIDDALETWKKFLLDERYDVGKFDQHLFICGEISNASNIDDLPPNINRYFLRSVDCTLATSEQQNIVYTKMGKILILGFINILKPSDWKTTKLRIINGIFNSHGTRYSIPYYFGNFLIQRAGQILQLEKRISEKQLGKIHETMLNDLDKLEKSDSLSAMESDIALFGDKAFLEED